MGHNVLLFQMQGDYFYLNNKYELLTQVGSFILASIYLSST